MRRASCGAFLLGPILVFLLVGGVGFFLLSQKVQEKPLNLIPVTVSSTTQETILLAFANPRTTTDEVTALDLPDRTLRVLTPPANWRLSSFERQGMRVEELPVGDVYRLVREDGWNVVLRDSKGTAYEDPVILGYFDTDHVGVLARTDERVLLSVSRFGNVQIVTTIDEASSVRFVKEGFAWIVRLTPSKGIEEPLRGPSVLTQVTRTGVSTTVAQSPGAVSRVVPFLNRKDVFAYATEEGTLTAVSGRLRWQGTGIPLLWTNEQTLLFAQGKTLYRRDATTSTAEKLIDLRALPSGAFVSSTSLGLW